MTPPIKSTGSSANGRPQPDAKLWAFRWLAIFVVVVVAEAVAIGILWWRWRAAEAIGGAAELVPPDFNYIKAEYPAVDFSRVYPGLSEQEIDRVQRETFGLPYIFEPFTGFRLAPAKKATVEVSDAGFRGGVSSQPWPPEPAAENVFVFGGSTTFGYAVGTGDTLPVALEKELQREFPGRKWRCYNFGCGAYFSTQERVRFELLLAGGHVPKLAIFIDGLNDFGNPSGWPMFSERVARIFQPKRIQRVNIPPAAQAVELVLERYHANVRMIEAVAGQWRTRALFVAQPVPQHELPGGPEVYPFKAKSAVNVAEEHDLCRVGYPKFKARTLAGEFGPAVVWCGDAFAQANTAMYADSVHYSPEGNRVLARAIVERAKAKGLLKL